MHNVKNLSLTMRSRVASALMAPHRCPKSSVTYKLHSSELHTSNCTRNNNHRGGIRSSSSATATNAEGNLFYRPVPIETDQSIISTHESSIDLEPSLERARVNKNFPAKQLNDQQVNQLCTHDFCKRHVGPREKDQSDMLATLGYRDLDALVDATIPAHIRVGHELNLPRALSEHELLVELMDLANMNKSIDWKSYIGMGYYDCITPAVITRNLFENAGWTSAYTAYQAEISQGRLEGLLNYQTLVAQLTGLDTANASLLDEATAAAEAMQMCFRHHKGKRNKLLISSRCHPQTLAVCRTRAEALQIQLDEFDELNVTGNDLILDDYCGVIVQYPNTQGFVYDLNMITQQARNTDCLVVAATDLLACALIKPPGDFESPVDIAIGSSQRLGVPLNYGGPHAAFMACQRQFVRLMPGRVVGVTRDANGKQAYRFALQTREQHIRRDKATSNICTAQALLANMSAMYGVYHGPDGLREIARAIHRHTQQLKLSVGHVSNRSWRPINGVSYFDTLTFECSNLNEFKRIQQSAQRAKINLRYYADQRKVGVSLDETTRDEDVKQLASLFACDNSMIVQNLVSQAVDHECVLPLRTSSFLEHETFTTYKSEAQLVRYMKRLENKDISLVHSMIPLGSCTMKLNASVQMIASSWPHFTHCHPYQPMDQCEGYQKMFDELNDYLCEISGYDRVSFQPNSGAQGEYAGLRCIKAYLDSIGQKQRDVCLIPISAHGTNPASAQMAGFKIETTKVMPDGSVDMEHLAAKIDQYRDRLACLMITYPSTFGVFEPAISDICARVHEAGGQVYLDGANLNAQVGLCRPGDYGSDVSHFNLHKTFCIPHGGGGPGAGPIGVKQHLMPFLPTHPMLEYRELDGQSFGTVSAAHWGSPAILPISWSYIRLMGDKLKRSSQVAILNANYMKNRLSSDYNILFTGANGNVAHEFILDCRPFKKSANIEALDIAKRLQDFGLHAPTVSFPIANTLMIEPTESEDRTQLDNYCDALLAIRQEILLIEGGKLDKLDNPIKNAPHTQAIVCSSHWPHAYSREQAAYPAPFVTSVSKMWPTVGRVDDTYGDQNLFCSCPEPPTPLS